MCGMADSTMEEKAFRMSTTMSAVVAMLLVLFLNSIPSYIVCMK